jgi:hypothetical protein
VPAAALLAMIPLGSSSGGRELCFNKVLAQKLCEQR